MSKHDLIIPLLIRLNIKINRFKKAKIRLTKVKLKKQILQLFLIAKYIIQRMKNRKEWVRYIFREERRFLQGASDNLIEEMETFDPEKYENYLRVTPVVFQELLEILEPFLTKQDTNFRRAIKAKTRLQILLRYLATGNSMTSISYEFRVGISTVSQIIEETSEVVYNILAPHVFLIDPQPRSWKQIADTFEKKWNLSHCVGAIDGKHMVLQAPKKSGSLYYSYKKSHSIIFLGVADADCKFIMFDAGSPGRNSDGGVFKRSEISRRFYDESMNLPPPSPIASEGQKVPYFLVGDEGFSLTKFLMTPYPRSSKLTVRKKVYNYRLCRARRIVECAFGLLVQRFRLFRRPIISKVSNAVRLVKAAVALHNFILSREPADVDPEADIDETNNTATCFRRAQGNIFPENEDESSDQQKIRDYLAECFMYKCAVPWQIDKIRTMNY